MLGLRSYWNASRTSLYGFVAGLPLFFLYEGLSAALNASVRNGAEVWIIGFLPLPQSVSVWAVKLLALAALGLLLLWRDKKTRIRSSFFAFMLFESVVYSLLLSTVVLYVLNQLFFLALPQGVGFLTQLTLSLGAGLYEELLFRVLLFGGLAALLKVLTKKATLSLVVAALVSALLFSAAHHVGALGEPFELTRFSYRAISGLLFTGLYVARGFGITAMTHALYDVWIVFGVL